MQKTFKESNFLYISLDEKYKIMDINKPALSFFESSKNEVIDKNFFLLCKEKEISTKLSQDLLRNHLKSSKKQFIFDQVDLENKQSKYIIWSLYTEAPNFFILIGVDITNLNLVDKDTSVYLRNIVDNVPHYIFWKDKNSVFLGCNKLFAASAGLSDPKEIIGKTDYDLPWGKFEAENYRKDDQKVIQRKLPKLNIEETQTTSDGRKIVLLTSKVPLFNEHNKVIGILGIYSDITEIKQTQESLREAKELAEAASNAKSEFIANMSHDIRTPITGILGLAQSIKDRSKGENQDDAELLIDSTEELLSLLNEVIEVVRIESGEVKDSNEDFNIETLIEHNAQLLMPAIRDKKIKFTFDINSEVPLYLYGNRIYLDRIILNLLSNAIKFTEKGQVSLTIKLKEKIDNRILLEIVVADTGIGIPKDKQEIIFDHFSRLSPSYQGLYQGYGLGLYTVKRYLEAMKGNIKVDSELGKGSRFIVSLPFTIGKEVAKKSEKIYEVTPPVKKLIRSTMNKMKDFQEIVSEENHHCVARILLVEDQFLAARMVIQLLQKMNCKVVHAKNGESAITYASQQPFDLILMDIGLPDSTGLEVAKKIRSLSQFDYSSTPIIALTGHMSQREKQQCLDTGMQDMLTKPLTKHAAKKILNRYCKLDLSIEKKSESQDTDKLSVINLDEAMSIVGGDIKIVKEVLEMLSKTLRQDFQEIQYLYEKKDYESLYELIHKFYGGLSYCGVPRLREVTQEIKSALMRKKFKEIEPLIKTLGDEIDLFMKEYEQLV